MTRLAIAALATGESTQLQAPQDVVDKVVAQKQVVTAETGGRALIAAPVHGASGSSPTHWPRWPPTTSTS